MNTVPFPTAQALEAAAPPSFWRGLLPALDFSFSLVPRSIRERVARRRQRKQFAELWVEETEAHEAIERGRDWPEMDSYRWPDEFKLGGFILDGLDVVWNDELGDVEEALAKLEGRIDTRVKRRNERLVEKRVAKSKQLIANLAQLKAANEQQRAHSNFDLAAAFCAMVHDAAERTRAHSQSIECEEVAQASFDSGVGLSLSSSFAQLPKSSARGWRKLSDSNPLKNFLRKDEQRLRARGIDPEVMPDW